MFKNKSKFHRFVFGRVWFKKDDFDYCMCGENVDSHYFSYGGHSPVPIAYHYFEPNILMRLFPKFVYSSPRMIDK